MKLKTKKMIINIISILLVILSVIFAYLYATGILKVEELKIEGIEMPTLNANVQTAIFVILAILNVTILILSKKLIKYKIALIVLEAMQAFIGSLLHIVAAIICIPILCVKTKDVEEDKKKQELPVLNPIKQRSKWTYLVIWMILFLIVYTGLFNKLIANKNEVIQTIMTCGIYVFQIIVLAITLKEDLKRDFTAFRKNFKTYMTYTLPRVGIFLLVYIIIAAMLVLAVGNISTNQQALNQMPIGIMALLAIIVAPFIEELTFRGLLKKVLNNKTIFVIFSALIFGLLHIMFVEENWLNYLYIIPYAMMGYLFAKLYVKTDNIFVSMFIHCMWNTIAVMITVLTQL